MCRYSAALTAYSEAIQLCPTNDSPLLSTLHSNRAATFLLFSYPNVMHPRDASEAIRDCHNSIAIIPSVKALYRLSCGREKLGQIRSAIAAVKAAIALEARGAVAGSAPSEELTAKLTQLEGGRGQTLRLEESQQLFCT